MVLLLLEAECQRCWSRQTGDRSIPQKSTIFPDFCFASADFVELIAGMPKVFTRRRVSPAMLGP